MGNIKWDAAKLKAYFESCRVTYNKFLAMSDSLINAFQAFVDDDTHTGDEAEHSKAFVSEKQIPLLIDIIDDVQQLESLQDSLMEAFAEEVDASATAIIKSEHLDKVTLDFGGYEDTLKTVGTQIIDLAVELNRTCREVGSYNIPDYSSYFVTMERIASNDGMTGIAPNTKKKLEAFDNAHANDVSISTYQNLYDTIMSNIQSFINGTGDGKSYDITSYDGKKNDLNWKNPLDYLEGAALAEYQQFVKDMHAYLKGKKERCEVYKYDPVNMCNGNYIDEETDITLGGRYPIEFKRFYNSIANELKDLGWGWTHSFEVRIYDIESDSKIRIAYADGSEGTFKKEKDYYVEEHGEPGILQKLEDTNEYIITQDNGTYQKFDWDGRLVAFGDLDGDHTTLRYELLEDRSRRLSTVFTKYGNSLEFAFYEDGDCEGLLKSVTDHTGRVVSYTYDSSMHLTGITDVNGYEKGFTYTEDGKIKDVINPNGVVAITNEYDSQHRTTKQNFPDGTVMTYAYDDISKTTTATEQNGNKVVYTHDELMRHTATKYYDGTERFTYNARNQKTSFTDKKGNTTRYAYDNKGHMTKIVDALGNKTFITYRADGKPMSVKGAKGEVFKYGYDLNGKLFELKNPLGETNRFYYKNGNLYKTKAPNGGQILFDYDDRGNVKQITDADGVVTEYSYDELNRVVSTTTADGAVTAYEYDNSGRLTRTIDAHGNTREYTYDANGNVTSVKEADGTVKAFDMNVMGRVSKVTDEAGNVTEITYNVMGKQEKVLLPNGGVILYEYDPLMRLTKVTDPEGRTKGYDYDANGNVVAEYLGDIKVRSLEYNALNRVIREVDALGYEKTYEYDESGNITSACDTLGNRTIREFDLLGRVILEVDPLGNETRYTYTKLGDVETITDPANRVRRFEYTDGGKVSEVYFCDKLEQRFTYDNVGRVLTREMADGYMLSYSYDSLGRVTLAEDSCGRNVAYEYDAMGRATKVIDGRSTTLYTYTATGLIKSVVDALGNETSYTYDALDNMTSIHRAEGLVSEKEQEGKKFPKVGKDGHVTLYSYDLSGQLTSITDAMGNVETYQYDQYGRLVSKTDRDSFVTSYSYNPLGAITKVGYGDGRAVEFAYNELNQLNEINDWLGKTTIENDILGRLTKVTDYQNRTVSYEYGKMGDRTKLVYPDGKSAVYTYDAEGRLSNISGNGEETTYSYDEFGRLTLKLLPNGVSTEYSYLPGGNLQAMTSYDGKGELDSYAYSYDSLGFIDKITRNRRDLQAVSGQYKYQYDALGRLTESSLNGQVKSAYEYDAFGNRTSLIENDVKTSYKYDALDRLIKSKEHSKNQTVLRTYEYDNRGNQTKEFVDGLLAKTLTYDATNMLSKVVDSANAQVENQYNGLGFRVASTSPEAKIEYLCDLSRDYYNLLERTVNGERESFLYDSNVISMSKAGSSYYYLQDELGSPMYMTGTDGVPVTSYAFDDFGRNVDPFTGKLKENGGGHGYTTDGNIIQPFAFTGYQEDEVSGLKFAQARFYDASTGRFQSEDNVKGFIDSPFTLNRYGYCWSNPIALADRDGNFGESIVNAIDKTCSTMANGISVVGSTVSNAASGAGKWVADNKTDLLKTGAKLAVGAAIGVGCVLAAPVVVPALTGALAASSLSAAAATVVTTAAIGAGISGTTSIANQLIDNGKVDFKKVGLDTLSGGLKGAVTGAVAATGIGAVGAFGVKMLSNAVIDTSKDFTEARFINGESYGKVDVAKSVVSSIFATSVGHLIGKCASKLPVYSAISKNVFIDLENSSGKDIYEDYSGIMNNWQKNSRGGRDVYETFLYHSIVAYITSNFISYDRGIIQKQIQDAFGIGFKELTDKLFGYIIKDVQQNNCATAN
ncbi:MAG: hypothetical protein IJR96_09765 [Pseudobutyrivibrio sp.]|nr:hypothetical protein [Pseudobutyrivibrio sp.]